MPSQTQKTNIANAIQSIRNAQNLLQPLINAAPTVSIAIKLTNEYNSLDTCLSQLLHAKNSADDGVFSSAAGVLKSQAGGLQMDEKAIKAIISDVAIADQVVGHIGEAIRYIAMC